MSILLVCRLEVRFISTFLIIIPVFISIGCCCCISVCFLTCMANVDMGDEGATMDLKSADTEDKNNIKTPILSNEANTSSAGTNYGSTQPVAHAEISIVVDDDVKASGADGASKKGDVDID